MSRWMAIVIITAVLVGSALALNGAGTEGDPWLIQSAYNSLEEQGGIVGNGGAVIKYTFTATDTNLNILVVPYNNAPGISGMVLTLQTCQYTLVGDLNNDCRVNFLDFALMADNWLIDCYQNPSDPACVPK